MGNVETRVPINKKYKDTLFRTIFREKEDLFYVASEYEKLVNKKKLFGRKLVKSSDD